MGAEATVTIRVEDEHTGNLDVTGPQMGALIGRHGEISAALQYLVSLASNSKKGNNYYRISVNIGKYRQRRDGIIEDLATKTAERSLRIGKNIAFEPMNPYERRVVHTTIQGVEGASSWSMGEGSERHVVVGPAGVREGEEGLPPRRGLRAVHDAAAAQGYNKITAVITSKNRAGFHGGLQRVWLYFIKYDGFHAAGFHLLLKAGQETASRLPV